MVVNRIESELFVCLKRNATKLSLKSHYFYDNLLFTEFITKTHILYKCIVALFRSLLVILKESMGNILSHLYLPYYFKARSQLRGKQCFPGD